MDLTRPIMKYWPNLPDLSALKLLPNILIRR